MSLVLSRSSSMRSRAAVTSLGALLLAACPGDDTSQDTDATEGTTGSATSTGPDPDSTSTLPTSTTVDPPTSTTDVLDDTGTTTDEPPPAGTCAGLTAAGHIDTVLSRDGMPIDTTCATDPAPCGGDVVGDWSLEAICGFEAYPNPFEAMCPGSSFMIEILAQSGTISFVDDGTFVQDFDIQTQIVSTIDTMACLGTACDAFEGLLQMDDPDVTCQAMGPNCTCTIPDDGMPETAMGTYEVIGNNLVLTVDGEQQAAEYCIGGDRIDLWQPLFEPAVYTDVVCATDQDCVDAIGDMYDAAVCVPDEG